MKGFCVGTLNTLKRLCVYFGIPCFFILGIAVMFKNTALSESIAYYASQGIAYWLFFCLPMYWFLLIIQKIMTCIWDNPQDYINMYDEYGEATFLF